MWFVFNAVSLVKERFGLSIHFVWFLFDRCWYCWGTYNFQSTLCDSYENNPFEQEAREADFQSTLCDSQNRPRMRNCCINTMLSIHFVWFIVVRLWRWSLDVAAFNPLCVIHQEHALSVLSSALSAPFNPLCVIHCCSVFLSLKILLVSFNPLCVIRRCC